MLIMNSVSVNIKSIVPFITAPIWEYNICRKIIEDSSIDGKKYRKQIAYMNNSVRIGNKLYDVLINESKSVIKIITYIMNNLGYNENIIELSPIKLSTRIKLSTSNISTAINRCIKLNIIKRLSDIEGFENASKKFYTVNHNYIFNGSIQELDNAYRKLKNK